MIISILYGLAYLFSGLVLLVFGRLMFKAFNSDIDVRKELTEKDNLAFGFSMVGYFTGITFTIGAALMGEHVSLAADILNIALYGFGSIVLLNLSFMINEWFILPHFKIRKEVIEDQNIGAGIIEGIIYISSGIIIYGATLGGFNIVAIFVAWISGIVALIIATRVYNWITPYNVHKEIEEDNIAAGIAYSGAIMATGVLIGYAISLPHDSYLSMVLHAAGYMIVAVAILPVFRFLTDKIILPGANLNDEIVNQDVPNIACGIIEGMTYVGTALLITWCF